MRQHVVHFGNLALSYITYGCAVSIDPGTLSTFFLVHFIPSGRCQIQVGRDELVRRVLLLQQHSPCACAGTPNAAISC
jgi:hypothetical protein